ncbi:Helix-turn-helix [Chryseobacterium culicis]|uniref:Helix-turn-helix n=2 Tax=Chryseobacterium culicis TaxID=680127 RepID=A0A1H6H6F9_CHRCI|nr:Helix-turn-helix [Chryseobacterium culicis]
MINPFLCLYKKHKIVSSKFIFISASKLMKALYHVEKDLYICHQESIENILTTIMSKLKAIREQKNLTQEELSEKSKISVRTIQRIESGTVPKGHTRRALAQALEIEESGLMADLPQAAAPAETVEMEEGIEERIEEETVSINYSYVKIINLSSLLFTLLPPLNILVPLLLMFTMKQKNNLVRQIISVQMIWTVMAPVIFMLGIFLKLGKQFTPILMILIVLSNVFIILRNASEIDRNKKLYFCLKFSMI